MPDSLGDRMKEQYEDRYRISLPRRTYTVIRVDGKAFHTLTRHMEKPYDKGFMNAMDVTALALCKSIQGTQFAFTQSDEISLLLTDFDSIQTDAWFDGNLQKMCSIAAATASVAFNRCWGVDMAAVFDARVFVIPDRTEVMNYYIWRQQDAERNSLQMLAQHYYSHKELHGKKSPDLHDMIHAKGDNWNNHPEGFRRGRVQQYWRECLSHGWGTNGCPPVFTQDRAYLGSLIPDHPGYDMGMEG